MSYEHQKMCEFVFLIINLGTRELHIHYTNQLYRVYEHYIFTPDINLGWNPLLNSFFLGSAVICFT